MGNREQRHLHLDRLDDVDHAYRGESKRTNAVKTNALNYVFNRGSIVASIACPRAKHDNHKIDEDAKVLMASTFRGEHWTLHDENNDYGIDYRVDLFVHGNPSGIYFFAQLKGQKRLSIIENGKYAQLQS